MPFTSHYEHAYSAWCLAVARDLNSTLTQQVLVLNSRMLGLSGRLVHRLSDTKLARAGAAGESQGVTNY